jgi:hypothetical protein
MRVGMEVRGSLRGGRVSARKHETEGRGSARDRFDHEAVAGGEASLGEPQSAEAVACDDVDSCEVEDQIRCVAVQ